MVDRNYLIDMDTSLSWHEVEDKIRKEAQWLNNSIKTFDEKDRTYGSYCKQCVLRNLAEMIVFGEVQVMEINRSPDLKSFWLNFKNKSKDFKKIDHGQKWHIETITTIENHFSHQGFSIIREPTIYLGRADLGVYNEGAQDLFVEVGTTSLYKLYINLRSMRNCTYLIVPSDSRLIEFRKT